MPFLLPLVSALAAFSWALRPIGASMIPRSWRNTAITVSVVALVVCLAFEQSNRDNKPAVWLLEEKVS